MNRFHNKVVVITGGTSGIGLAAASQFQKEGAQVVVTGRKPEALAEAGKVLGPSALVVAADVTKGVDLDGLFTKVRQKHGRIDVLYVNAGTAKLGPVEKTSEALFDEILDTNFRGAYFTV